MFSTFIGTPQSLTRNNKGVSETPEQPSTKQKRHQVHRACECCRAARIKCDSNVPCGNCRNKGRQCSNRASRESRTLPEAYREIERLRDKIRQLETQLDDERRGSQVAFPSPPLSTENASPASHSEKGRTQQKRHWEGVHISTAVSQQRTWYGPFSLFYFISRMNTYLAAALQQPHPDKHTQPNTVARSFWSLDCNTLKGTDAPQPRRDGRPVQSGQIPTVQEEYFISLFWQSHHSSLPVLNEVEFKEHCKSLWVTPGKNRKPSALVDIVIAMSMQYGMTLRTRTSSGTEVDSDDSTIAGRWYYRRCQALLSRDFESPTISTVQCQILSVIYLCCASFQNMAHSTLATAVRTANMLGLHMEPPAEMPKAERELRKRIWWSLYTLESKTCMKLGRPFSTSLESVFCELPADDHETAGTSGSDFAPLDENVTWLTYNLQHTKMVLAVRSIHTTLLDRCSDIYPDEKGGVVYDDPVALKRCANSFSTSVTALKIWAQEVPEVLKTERKGDGVSFSRDLSELAVEPFAPLWVQRQRLLLELLYHNLSMNLHRMFITYSTPQLADSTSGAYATLAAEHGMAITNIMHQIMTQTDILAGWHEAFQWQWNAAITLIGYLLASPGSSTTGAVRKAVDRALTVFEVFGRSFAAAASAAAVVRGLVDKTDFLNEESQVRGATALSATNLAEINIGMGHSSGGFLEPDGNDYMNNGMLNLMDEVNMAAMHEVLAARPVDMGYLEDSSGGLGDFDGQFLPFMSI